MKVSKEYILMKTINTNKGRYSIKEILSFLLKNFPEGFMSKDASSLVCNKFENNNTPCYGSSLFLSNPLFSRLYHLNILNRKIVAESKDKNGRIKRYYFYEINKKLLEDLK